MSKNYFQDDSREHQMIELFELVRDTSEGRSGVDAFLELGENKIPFELKTTSKGSVTTVRDFGLDHIKKWQGKHWLFGFYQEKDVYYKYGSPSMIAPWIEEKAEYRHFDFKLADIVSKKLTLYDLYKICGKKKVYSYHDARRIQKKQYKKDKYLALQDVKDGYSSYRMLEILSDRVNYLIERGSTLNNPHIPASYFSGWEEITDNHAIRLRNLVKQSLNL
ncbi:MAG: hypothetical protein DRQ99_04685 [Candidatus Parabeggiatoa sp. nov. 3]|nr:MAG: hypothetical protein B6247_23160 [Beggiatoa sp. 4572_84]RKZ68128.1 MAG: hypothetical protein DRQ99_04685 [Gammaproteobacteria bacterium]